MAPRTTATRHGGNACGTVCALVVAFSRLAIERSGTFQVCEGKREIDSRGRVSFSSPSFAHTDESHRMEKQERKKKRKHGRKRESSHCWIEEPLAVTDDTDLRAI